MLGIPFGCSPILPLSCAPTGLKYRSDATAHSAFALAISRRTYYRYRNQEDPDYHEYLLIKGIFDESKGTYGYRRIEEGLKIKYGVKFNHKKVARIMKKYNLKPEYIRRIRPNMGYKRIAENVQPDNSKPKV